jgi:arginase
VNRTLGIIGAPSSSGAFAPGQEKSPQALRDAGLVRRMRDAGIDVVDHGDLPTRRWHADPAHPRAQNVGAVVETATDVAGAVAGIVHARQLPIVIGGDCTIAVGTVAGLTTTNRRLGLVYFDLHADLNVPDSVPEGALDWMGMSHLLGEDRATPELSRFGLSIPLLDDADVCVFAHGPNRATAWEREVIARRNLRTVPVADVAADPEGAVAAALAALVPRIDRLLVHFDVDVVDFTDAPLSENTGRNEGLTLEQAFRALRVFVASPAISALTITELNPDHGEEDGATLKRFVAGLVDALAASPAVAQV